MNSSVPMLRDCNNCGVSPRSQHESGCDTARCQYTGLQEISCSFSSTLNHKIHAHTCIPDVWTGRWPGVAECEEYGFWSYFVPGQWISCDRDHPEAVHDLNRLVLECMWDREQQKWIRRPEGRS